MNPFKFVLFRAFFGIVLLGCVCGVMYGLYTFWDRDNTGEEEPVPPCGWSLEADFGELEFPTSGQEVHPGEICIWTLHLPHTSNVTFTFPSLNINGTGTKCEDGGVRIYSLTNLIPAGSTQNLTYCNENSPGNTPFTVNGNLIAIVFHIPEESNNTGAGFTLEWLAIPNEDTELTHNFSRWSDQSGFILYPDVNEGQEFLSRHIATWVVEIGEVYNAALQMQVTVPYIGLDKCDAVDPCTCDALILYQVTGSGVLREETRLCENATDTEIEGIGAYFIVAFFTDEVSSGSSANGFELEYMPISNVTLSTTVATTTI